MWWRRGNGPVLLIGTICLDELDADQIMSIHINSGHPGVQCTTYFVRRVCPSIIKAAIRSAIRVCEECQSIDPVPIHWEKGRLEVNGNWQTLGMDIMYYGVHHFLTLTGPSCISVWKQLARQDSANVIRQLEAMFFEWGLPQELLTDNDPTFCSREFRAFAHEWSINLWFCCMYALTENGIAEHCHCTH